MKCTLAVVPFSILVSACAMHDLNHGPEPTTTAYTDPKKSGLIAVRPYPNPGDVCQVIAKNDLTSTFLDDNAILIGCPKHEKGAIADRLREGGIAVGHAKHWTLISIPQG